MDRNETSSVREDASSHRDFDVGGDFLSPIKHAGMDKSDPSYDWDWMCESLPFAAAEW
ncbi:hypothetical protein AWB82_03291 [Caballeronia glebae]|uniref:Uncharacterized protein n=1 Tax=Caballeronia glebae TaxID=1777143 RepID=A0A158B0R1_9BURK|nr:hypothetical protein [Caballeronia glebae]SAK63296.1 hypothetical protein AWB82_03291 [Caballeronia glebae]